MTGCPDELSVFMKFSVPGTTVTPCSQQRQRATCMTYVFRIINTA